MLANSSNIHIEELMCEIDWSRYLVIRFVGSSINVLVATVVSTEQWELVSNHIVS